MKKTVLCIAALLFLVLALNPTNVFALDADYEQVEYEAEEIAEDNADEVIWRTIRVPLDSPREFVMRVQGGFTVNTINNRNWIWIVHPLHLQWLTSLNIDVSFFNCINDAMLSTPQLHYAMNAWNWDVETFWDLDMPTIHFFAEPYAQVVFDFHTMMLQSISWGGEATREAELTGGVFAPGSSITLPGSPSFTAMYVRGAYGPGNPVEYGHALILVEVLGEDGRRAPAYSHDPQDNIPSPWAAQSIIRANELGILPEFMDRSLRRPINRNEVANFAVILYETITQSEITGRADFNDTTDINAQKLGYLGVLTGDDYGNFNPVSLVSREQAAILITRTANALGLVLPSTDIYIADYELISEWAVEAVAHAIAMGFMSLEDGFFDPQDLTSREEFIVMVVHLYDLLR